MRVKCTNIYKVENRFQRSFIDTPIMRDKAKLISATLRRPYEARDDSVPTTLARSICSLRNATATCIEIEVWYILLNHITFEYERFLILAHEKLRH
jgi:hypothetical protein